MVVLERQRFGLCGKRIPRGAHLENLLEITDMPIAVSVNLEL